MEKIIRDIKFLIMMLILSIHNLSQVIYIGMEVPFRGNNKWNYADYYRYINTELKHIVNLSR